MLSLVVGVFFLGTMVRWVVVRWSLAESIMGLSPVDLLIFT